MAKRFVAIIVAAGLAMGSALAGPFEDGVAAYAAGDFAKALGLWRPLGEREARAESLPYRLSLDELLATTSAPVRVAVIEAAAKRGVKIRLYLDPEQPGGRDGEGGRVKQLMRGGNVAARVKGQGMDYMHLKTFQVDGRWLRTGSTNFSFAGQRRQDNDIIVLESRAVAEAFIQQFEILWKRSGNIDLRP